MMRPSTFFFLTRRGVRNLGKHWAMTIACIASLSVCMTLNIFASLAEVNVGSMVAYLGSQNETVVYLDPECDDATAAQVGETLSAMPGVSGVQYVSKQDVLDTYRGYMQDYSSLWDEFETDNPFKANYRVTLSHGRIVSDVPADPVAAAEDDLSLDVAAFDADDASAVKKEVAAV